MDLTPPPSFFASHGEVEANNNNINGFLKGRKENPFVDSFPDPLCKLNLKETSDFVKAFPVSTNNNESRVFLDQVSAAAQRRKEGATSVTKRNVVEAPTTPGRPIFSFSIGNASRKNFPSKWDDAEKWVINGTSCTDSPAHNQLHQHGFLKSSDLISKQCNGYNLKPRQHQVEVFSEKSRVTEEKVSKAISIYQGPTNTITVDHHNSTRALNGVSEVSDILLNDKFTNEVEPTFPKFRCLEPMKEGFLFGNSSDKSMTDAATEVVHEVQRRDIGTEMTPLGSSTTSRCPTPFKSLSPPRHNTPANRSGPLALTNLGSTIDIAEFQECHLAKLQLGTQFDSVASNWSSREEEEEDISKSLRHFEMSNEYQRSVSEPRACAWEEEEKTKFCLRYQREEAKIQAWVNLQNAKAEAQSRKLEVKIQKMRSNLEEKLMKRMAIVHRKAEELRAAAQVQHIVQIQRAAEQAKKTMNMNRHQRSHFSGHGSCGCFPCNTSVTKQ